MHHPGETECLSESDPRAAPESSSIVARQSARCEGLSLLPREALGPRSLRNPQRNLGGREVRATWSDSEKTGNRSLQGHGRAPVPASIHAHAGRKPSGVRQNKGPIAVVAFAVLSASDAEIEVNPEKDQRPQPYR